MKNSDIKILLEKYFEGETDLRDEKILQHYFLYEDVAADLLKYKVLFVAFQQENRIILEKTNDDPLSAIKVSKVVSLNKNTAWAVAASIIFLIGSWFILNKENTQIETPSQQELLVAQKYLNMSFQAFDRAYNQSNDLIKKTKMLQKHSDEALKVGLIYQEKTQEILNLKYIDQSFEKLKNVSSLKKSRIKLMM